MEAAVEGGDVDVDDVPVLELPHVGDAVADHLGVVGRWVWVGVSQLADVGLPGVVDRSIESWLAGRLCRFGGCAWTDLVDGGADALGEAVVVQRRGVRVAVWCVWSGCMRGYVE